jgi:hypothetical protein
MSALSTGDAAAQLTATGDRNRYQHAASEIEAGKSRCRFSGKTIE